MATYRNTLSHRIGPVTEDGEILKIRAGETYEATGELEEQVKAMPGQEPVKQKQSKGKGKGSGSKDAQGGADQGQGGADDDGQSGGDGGDGNGDKGKAD